MQQGKIPGGDLLEAGLQLMDIAGKPLKKVPARGRAMIYELPDGETVRVRTCNDHILIVLADSTNPDEARLNIEGTDFLLVVMPEKPRARGPVWAYLVPTAIAADAARKAHKAWLESSPRTKGKNLTWNLWFEDGGPPMASGFAKEWERFRVPGSASTDKGKAREGESTETGRSGEMKLGDVILLAKEQIAEAAGVSPDAVRISVDLA